MQIKLLFEKIKRRIWGGIVRALCGSVVYPLLYRSWWHSRFFRSKNSAAVQQFLAARPNPGAGIGHQMANWIAGLWFARVFDLSFAHIPFSSKAWEQFLGFGNGEKTLAELVSFHGYRVVTLPGFDELNDGAIAEIRKIILSYAGRKAVFVLEQDQGYRDQFGVMSQIQCKFENSASRSLDKLVYDADCFNVAVHVRRGDIVAGQMNGNPNLVMRWQDAKYFENVLAAVLGKISTVKPVMIFVFSQGSREELQGFEKFGQVEFCLDMGAQESFLHMQRADLLITSKSSFSYKPALLSRGVKVCPRHFWHGYPDGDDWVLADEDGTLDEIAVRKLLLI
jgi:hypothetical protein